MKKRPKERTTMTAREVAVLIEDFDSKLRAVAEGVSALKDKSDTMMGMIATNAEGINTLRLHSAAIRDEITKINGKLAHIEDIIRTFDKRITQLEGVK